MIRFVVESLLLLLLPSIIYFSYVFLARRKNTTGRQAVNDAPIIWLFISGIVLFLAGILYFATTSGGSPDSRYVPSVFKDGKLQPGRLVEPDDKQ